MRVEFFRMSWLTYSIYDVIAVIVLSPLFLIRVIHYIIDRFVLVDTDAIFAVDGFGKEFR